VPGTQWSSASDRIPGHLLDRHRQAARGRDLLLALLTSQARPPLPHRAGGGLFGAGARSSPRGQPRDVLHEPLSRRQARGDAAKTAQRRRRRRGAAAVDLLRRGRSAEVRRRDGVSDHPLRPLRIAGRARAQRHEGDARRHRAQDARPQGRDDPRPRQHPAEPHARPQAVRLRKPDAGQSGTMTKVDVLELAEILREAAKAEILPRFRRLDPKTIHTKSSATDLVTEADTEAERRIKLEIAKRWPEAVVVGEESVAADPALLHRVGGADLAITVDPVDGTANFAAGLPLYAVMASVVVKGEAVGGIWLHRPNGASERLKVARAVPLAQTVAHVSISFLDPAYKAQVLGNLAKLAISANYRVAGHDYRTMASGHCHAVLFNKLMPWDHLPGTLICAEAGAYVRKFDGSEYRPTDLSGGLLLACDKEQWSLLRREVFTV